MGYESKQTTNPGMVEDKERDAVSIHTTNARSGVKPGSSASAGNSGGELASRLGVTKFTVLK